MARANPRDGPRACPGIFRGNRRASRVRLLFQTNSNPGIRRPRRGGVVEGWRTKFATPSRTKPARKR